MNLQDLQMEVFTKEIASKTYYFLFDNMQTLIGILYENKEVLSYDTEGELMESFDFFSLYQGFKRGFTEREEEIFEEWGEYVDNFNL